VSFVLIFMIISSFFMLLLCLFNSIDGRSG